jgi:F-type H+-transporting ATPase subunit alpha
VISITDGQIFLSSDLFNSGFRPAINVGISVSRVGSAAQTKAIKKVAGKIKGQLANYRELAAFAQFGSDLDAKTKSILDRGGRIVELFKQTEFMPMPVEIQVGLIWAVQNNYFDDIEVEDVVAAAASLRENLESVATGIMDKIRSAKALDDETEAELKAAIEAWKSTYVK